MPIKVPICKCNNMLIYNGSKFLYCPTCRGHKVLTLLSHGAHQVLDYIFSYISEQLPQQFLKKLDTVRSHGEDFHSSKFQFYPTADDPHMLCTLNYCHLICPIPK